MIVCWALFGGSVFLGLASAALTMHYQTEIDATQERLDQLEEWTPEELEAEITTGVVLQRSRDRSLLELEIVNLNSDQYQWIVTASAGLFLGIVLFIWNIMWHIGHWIWMGR